MPSLDGYSLNGKIERLHDDVQAQIEQLQQDFYALYNMLDKMKERPNEKASKESPKKTKKESVQHAKA